jgi:hypothetical protein
MKASDVMTSKVVSITPESSLTDVAHSTSKDACL